VSSIVGGPAGLAASGPAPPPPSVLHRDAHVASAAARAVPQVEAHAALRPMRRGGLLLGYAGYSPAALRAADRFGEALRASRR